MESYEYEMPAEFEDEEIEEEEAFTAEDKLKYAGWFGEDGSEGEGDEAGESDEEDAEEQGAVLNSDSDEEVAAGPASSEQARSAHVFLKLKHVHESRASRVCSKSRALQI